MVRRVLSWWVRSWGDCTRDVKIDDAVCRARMWESCWGRMVNRDGRIPRFPETWPTIGHKLADLVASSSDGHLVGAYLHGSAALGGWVATRSDVDILIVLRDPLAGATLTAVEQVLAEHGPGSPGTGLECSVVTLAQAANPSAPWPFLAHVQASHGKAPVRVLGDSVAGDRDVLMHYVVCRSRRFRPGRPRSTGGLRLCATAGRARLSGRRVPLGNCQRTCGLRSPQRMSCSHLRQSR